MLTLPQQKLSHPAHRRTMENIMFCGSSLQLPFLRSHCMRRHIRNRAENQACRHQSISIGQSLSQQYSDNSLVVEACLTRFQLSHCRRWKATVALMQCWLLVGAISAHQLAGDRTGRSSEPWRMLPVRRA